MNNDELNAFLNDLTPFGVNRFAGWMFAAAKQNSAVRQEIEAFAKSIRERAAKGESAKDALHSFACATATAAA